jgi:hypothetical protein
MSYLINYPSTSTTYTLAAGSATNTAWATVSANGSSNLSPNTLQVKGNSEFEEDANFLGDIKVQGKSLKESLEKIEERLAILHPNEELEEKWEQLRGLRKLYMELEAEIIEKEKVWSILKK